MRGLAPGSYKIFSWAGIENNEWEDADFLKLFEDKGETVELQDEDAKTLNLKVIEKEACGDGVIRSAEPARMPALQVALCSLDEAQ